MNLVALPQFFKKINQLISPTRINHHLISDAAIDIVLKLQENNYEAYIVGGAIRDILLDHSPKDFDIGGELSIPNYKKIDLKKVSFLEQELDRMNDELPPLKDFILPGGSKAASYCHLGRTVCRRVERNLFLLNDKEEVNKNALKYINRLSDFLFVLARYINKENNVDDILWQKDI